MADGFLWLVFLLQGHAEVVMGFGEVGIDLQRFFEVRHRLVKLLLLTENDPKIVVSFRIAGVDLKGFLKMWDRLIELTLSLKVIAEIVLGNRFFGFHAGVFGRGRVGGVLASFPLERKLEILLRF